MLSQSIQAELRRLQLHPVNLDVVSEIDGNIVLRGKPAAELACTPKHRRTMVSQDVNGLARLGRSRGDDGCLL